MSLLLFRLYDKPDAGLYRFDGSKKGSVYLQKLDPNSLEPIDKFGWVAPLTVLEAIADVRNEIVDSYPKLDAIQLAQIAKDLLQIINRPYAQVEIAELKAELADELEKWEPLITMFNHEIGGKDEL